MAHNSMGIGLQTYCHLFERCRLRERHDPLECQRCSMSIVPVRNASSRVTEDFDRGFGDMLVIMVRARLAKVLQYPEAVLSLYEFGRVPPSRNTGSFESGSSGMMLLGCSCTVRFIVRSNALPVFTRR
jgi:hypothetical protein